MGRLGFLFDLLVATVVVAAIVAVAVTGAIAIRALPRTSGSLAVAGLDGPVTVTRDANGIAWIEAASPHDLFLAQGWVHASERFWQMEVWRRISAGRMSELFGEATLEIDRYVRTLNWRGSAVADLGAMAPDARAALDAYAEGVNAWLAANEGELGLPVVVVGLMSGTGDGIAGYVPEPWSAVDSAAFQKLQAFNLGGNLDSEIFRMLADARLGDPARTDELFPPYPPGAPIITPTGLPGSGGAGAGSPAAGSPAAAATGGAGAGAAGAGAAGAGSPGAGSPAAAGPRPAAEPGVNATPAAFSPAEADGWRSVGRLGAQLLTAAGFDRGAGLAGDRGVGSNSWVVSADHSATGGALLANDPHLGASMPSVWFINGLRCRERTEACPFDVAGVSFPSAPGVVLGHNDRIAWGATNAGPDVQDLYLESVDPADPTRYLADGRSVPFQVRREVIAVAGRNDPEILEVRATRHGPVLNDVDERLSDGPILALSWTTLLEPDRTFEAILHVNTARTFEAFREALRPYGSPAQNFVYADVAGHVGYVLPGSIPVRANAADLGARPRPGAEGTHEWAGRIPSDDLPWQLDPAGGLIVTANNAAVDAAYPHLIGREWDPGDRAGRATELLGAAFGGRGVTMDEMGDVQLDAVVPRAVRMAPAVGTASPETADGRLVQERILAWDATCGVASQGCAAWFTFELALLRAVLDDDLGLELASDYVGAPPSWVLLERLLDDPDAGWWDDVATAGVRETRDGVMAAVLDRVGADLRAELGGPGRWTWGRLHQVTFREATLGESGIPPLDWTFNARPEPVAGAAGALLNTYHRPSLAYPDPEAPDESGADVGEVFGVTNLPSYRLLIDMSEIDRARIVITTGQSGNPLSPHYADLVDDWAAGRTIPLPFSRDAVRAAAVETLTLRP